MRNGLLTTKDIAQARAMAEARRSLSFITCEIGCTKSTAWRHTGDILKRKNDERWARLLDAWARADPGDLDAIAGRFGLKSRLVAKRMIVRRRNRPPRQKAPCRGSPHQHP